MKLWINPALCADSDRGSPALVLVQRRMINRAPSARSRTWNPGLARWKLPPKTLPFRGGNGSCWKNGFSRETNKKGRCSEIRDSKLRSIDFLRESSRERKISDFGFGVWTFLSSWKLRMQNIFFFLFFFFQSGRRSRWIVIVTVQFATRLWQCETLEKLRRLCYSRYFDPKLQKKYENRWKTFRGSKFEKIFQPFSTRGSETLWCFDLSTSVKVRQCEWKVKSRNREWARNVRIFFPSEL